MRLFHEQGYNATGISTILREADVNSGSLYHFFPSKEALLIGVLQRYLEMLRPWVTDPAAASAPDPIERIFALLGQYRAGLEATGCALGCPIGNLALELSDNHAEIRALIDANFRQWCEVVESWLDEAAGRLPKELDRTAVARFVLAVMQGAVMQTRAARSLRLFDDSVAELRRYFDALSASAESSPIPRPGSH